MGNFSKLHEDYPWAKERLSMGHPYDITTNIFEKLPEIFKETYQIKEEEVRFYGRYKNERCYRWIKRDSPLIGEPLIGVTQTFLTIGAFDTRTEAEACLKYVKTKFARTMLGLLKATQHNPKDTWRLVPLQDFTAASDIDWTLSVAEIDQQLYHKYGLEAEEIAFIEEKVRAMG